MKSIISGAVMATAIVTCLTMNIQAKSVNPPAKTILSVSDTGKMAKDKMKMDKMGNKKMDKMAKDKMKKNKKMDKMKMSKDTAGKM